MIARSRRPVLWWCLVVVASPGCDRPAPPAADGLGAGPNPALVGPSESVPSSITDDAGVEVPLDGPPQRILSLVPSATEILIALGQLDRLVGRTDFDVGGDVAHLPSVGGGLAPSIETVVSLQPDLVVRFLAESDPDTPRQLSSVGVRHLAIRPDRIEDIRRIVSLLGDIVGQPAGANALAAAMDAELDSVAESVSKMARPPVAFLGGNPPSVAGPETFLHELIEFAGARNAFADIHELYAPISLEEMFAREVELILVPEVTPIPAALDRIRTVRVPVNVLTPGVRVGTSARLLSTLIHPELGR